MFFSGKKKLLSVIEIVMFYECDKTCRLVARVMSLSHDIHESCALKISHFIIIISVSLQTCLQLPRPITVAMGHSARVSQAPPAPHLHPAPNHTSRAPVARQFVCHPCAKNGRSTGSVPIAALHSRRSMLRTTPSPSTGRHASKGSTTLKHLNGLVRKRTLLF